MTLTTDRPGDHHTSEMWAPPAPRGRLARWRGRRRRRPVPTSSPRYVPVAALTVASTLLLGFCLQILLVGDVMYARAQQVALADLRYELARATAPIGQTFVPQPEIQEQALPGEESAAPPPPSPLLHALGTPVAVMSIEAIGMEDTVVLEGTTAGVLQKGPGHERNSVLPGQEGWSLLYGRAWSYGGPFGKVATLAKGDEIHVITGQGKHTYEVTGVRRAGDPLPQREPGQGRLVLGTAEGTPYVPDHVVYVDAVLTTDAQPAPPRRVLDLEPGEAILAGDSTAWFAILLWAEGLLASMLGLAWSRGRWGKAQTWIVGVPLLVTMGIGTAHSLARLLPNVL